MTPSRTSHTRTGVSSLRRLRTATLLLFTCFVLLVLGAGIYYLEQQRQAATEAAVHDARAVLDTVQYQASQAFGETLRVAEGMADVYREQLAHKQVSEAALHELMRAKLPRMQGLVTFTLFDAAHKGVAGSRSYPVDVSMILTSGMSFDSFADAGDGTFFGRLYRNIRPGALASMWFLPFGKVIRDDQDRVDGYVVALLSANFFSRYYATLPVGAHGRVSIWSDDGRLLAANVKANRESVDTTVADKMRRLRDAPSGRSIVETPEHGSIQDRVTALGLVGTLPFMVSVELDGGDFLDSWRATRNQILLAIGVVVLGAAIFAVIILRQVHHTEQNELALRQAKALAEEANDAKSRFLAHMSHEFRTPLNAIMGFSEIIKNRVLGGTVSSAYVAYADHIHRSGEHLLHIVNEILDTAKIELGGQPLQRQSVNLHATILGAVSFIEGLAGEKQLRLRIALPDKVPPVMSDERFARQVLINLLSNAIKFSPERAEIVIAARLHPDTGLTITVTDHGPGIEPGLLKRLGEPFLQGNPTLTHSGQGTGLGLSICKRYMEILGGEFRIDSTVGAGTTATIRFPRHLIIAEGTAPASPSSAPDSSAA